MISSTMKLEITQMQKVILSSEKQQRINMKQGKKPMHIEDLFRMVLKLGNSMYGGFLTYNNIRKLWRNHKQTIRVLRRMIQRKLLRIATEEEKRHLAVYEIHNHPSKSVIQKHIQRYYKKLYVITSEGFRFFSIHDQLNKMMISSSTTI